MLRVFHFFFFFFNLSLSLKVAKSSNDRNGTLTYLYKMEEGGVEIESYGISVAQRAGLPGDLLEDAWNIRDKLVGAITNPSISGRDNEYSAKVREVLFIYLRQCRIKSDCNIYIYIYIFFENLCV